MTTFHLVRHASHDLIGRVLAGRSIDIGLNAEGECETRALAGRLSGARAGRVLTSPRRRARETAAPVAAALGIDVEIAPALDEHDAGAWSGQSFQTLAPDAGWQRWNAHRSATRPPGGESMADLQARIVGFLRSLHRECPDAPIILISHAEPIRAAVLQARDIPLDGFMRADVPVASITTLTMDTAGSLRPAPAPAPALVREGAA